MKLVKLQPYAASDRFSALVLYLRGRGFKVMVEKPTDDVSYHFAHVTRQNIIGGFAECNDSSYWPINGRFAADNANCFNKWTHCPLVVPMPIDTTERDALAAHLEWLATPEAEEWSNKFGYIDDPKLPRVKP